MTPCTYCGSPYGDSLDHVLPQSEWIGQGWSRKVTVPACRPCNSALGARPFYTVGSRAQYLHRFYSQRWRKLLATPDWVEDELDALGPGMRTLVEDRLEQKRVCEAALKHMDMVALISPTIQEVWSNYD